MRSPLHSHPFAFLWIKLRLELVHAKGGYYVVENPTQSLLWEYKCVRVAWLHLMLGGEAHLSKSAKNAMQGPAVEARRQGHQHTPRRLWGFDSQACAFDAYMCSSGK